MAQLGLRGALGATCSCRHVGAAAARAQPVRSPLRSQFLGASMAKLRTAFHGLSLTTDAPSTAPGRRSLRVEANSKTGIGQTKRGTRRARTRTSGFRARMRTPNGRLVLKARRKKGRKLLCPASNFRKLVKKQRKKAAQYLRIPSTMSGGRERATGCSLLVRNLSRTVRVEDLRYTAEKYGRLRDVYIPKDFYSGEPRGIGFLEYTNPQDAEDAIYGLDRKVLDGKEISVVLALQGRKAPTDFRGGGGYTGGSRRTGHGSPHRSSRRGRSRSRSRSRDRGRRGRSPSYSRSRSPRRHGRSRSRSASRGRSYTPSRSPVRSRSPRRDASRSPAADSPEPKRTGHDSPRDDGR